MLIRSEGYSEEDAAALFEQCLERWSGTDVSITEVPLAAMRETIESRERTGVSGEQTSPYMIRYGTSIRTARVMMHRGKIELWTADGRIDLANVKQFWLVSPSDAPTQPQTKTKHPSKTPAPATLSKSPRPFLRDVSSSSYVDDDCAPTQAGGPPAFIWTRERGFRSTKESGKWCIIRPAEEIDALWEQVRAAVLAGRYPAALVSTAAQAAMHGGSYVICLFTSDWTDADAVMTARDFLRSIGVTEEINYKRDIETVNNVYGGSDEFVYQA